MIGFNVFYDGRFSMNLIWKYEVQNGSKSFDNDKL